MCAKQAAAAAKKASVRRAVVLSSAGAHSGPGTGPVGPARDMENEFEAALPAVVSLRPGIFMENFLQSIEMIAKAGQVFLPIPGGKRWPVVATADIADKAADGSSTVAGPDITGSAYTAQKTSQPKRQSPSSLRNSASR